MSEHILKYTGPVPEGYELTGEVRVPKPGEYVLDDDMMNVIAREALVADHVSVILRSKKWRPKTDETYWTIQAYHATRGRMRAQAYKWEGCVIDIDLYASDNCFRTKEEAESKIEEINAILKRVSSNEN